MKSSFSQAIFPIPIFLCVVFVALLLAVGCQSSHEYGNQVIPDSVDYNIHIRPILSDRCYTCHGPDENKREANLRLDIEEGAYQALQENSRAHVIVPGNPEKSELFLRVTATDSSLLMPPLESNLKLSAFEIELIKKWIAQGAKFKKHWAFIPPTKVKLPNVSQSDWVKNEIDNFVLSKLESMGLSPNTEASKHTLAKRLAFDLTGLPPSEALLSKFLADDSENAYEVYVDSLLAQPSYGEHMAAHWLDVARYADSHGYQDDSFRSQWPWRDWVIHAFNQNYSYEKFVTWQLAGDLLENPTPEQILATGFNRNHKITQEGGVIDEEYRIEYVTDRTNTFGKGFLSLTFECAKCHDHKYDPISQKEYFQTFAFFNQVDEKGFNTDVSVLLDAEPPVIEITTADVENLLRFINKPDTNLVKVQVMKDVDSLRITRILARGAYDAPTDTVSFGLPKALIEFPASLPQNRLGLAKWLFEEDHPLTARVYVNRIWQEIFGRGIVKTSGDFGMQGELPSHPELLDWLAVDFRENDWDIRKLLKKIVLSATYRQSSVVTNKHQSIDPENVYLARAPRFRYNAEIVRDLVLATSGLLTEKIGGPSVNPYQPPKVWEAASSGRGSLNVYTQSEGEDLYRRSLYTLIKRTVPSPRMLIFDASNRDQCEVKRLRTNTPLQALVMLNDPQVLEAARYLAQSLLEKEQNSDKLISAAFEKILIRKPSSSEMKILQNLYSEEIKRFKAQPELIEPTLSVGESAINQDINLSKSASLMQVIVAIFNMDEALTRV